MLWMWQCGLVVKEVRGIRTAPCPTGCTKGRPYPENDHEWGIICRKWGWKPEWKERYLAGYEHPR